jgi:hypothetical protein
LRARHFAFGSGRIAPARFNKDRATPERYASLSRTQNVKYAYSPQFFTLARNAA